MMGMRQACGCTRWSDHNDVPRLNPGQHPYSTCRPQRYAERIWGQRTEYFQSHAPPIGPIGIPATPPEVWT